MATTLQHLSLPSTFLLVADSNSTRSLELGQKFPALHWVGWKADQSTRANCIAILQSAREMKLKRLLLGELSPPSLLVVTSLFALAEGFDVYVCADAFPINSAFEDHLLLSRLRQHGAVTTTFAQIAQEFEEALAWTEDANASSAAEGKNIKLNNA